MPRGFLVKRTKTSGGSGGGSCSHRVRRGSDDDRSDSSSDIEHCVPVFGSPDSGFCQSPHRTQYIEGDRSPLAERFPNSGRNCLSLNSTPISSPITVTGASRDIGYPSPLYFSSFDRLTVSSPASSGPCIDLTSPKSEKITQFRELTPSSPNKRRTSSESDSKPKTPKKSKAIRKINFDEDTTSPVSGTIIRDLRDDTEVRVCGDIDSAYNIVDVTPEARAELERIDNKIGDYICQLCKELYPDAFQLAQHRCSRIIHVEYRCPECDKVFNCPANLASHRRWHKPKPNTKSQPLQKLVSHENKDRFSPHPNSLDLRMSHKMSAIQPELLLSRETLYGCDFCGKKFRRQAYLRKHLISHLIKSDSKVYPCDLTVPVVARDKHELPTHVTDNREFMRPHHPGNANFIHHPPYNQNNNTSNNNTSSNNNNNNNNNTNNSHSQRDTFPCPHCSETFFSLSKVTQHIHLYHVTSDTSIRSLPVGASNRPC